jgi:hypothetical protein
MITLEDELVFSGGVDTYTYSAEGDYLIGDAYDAATNVNSYFFQLPGGRIANVWACMGDIKLIYLSVSGELSSPADGGTITPPPVTSVAPAFTTNLSGTTTPVNGAAILTVVATGTPAPTFQWQKLTPAATATSSEWVNIPGATFATLALQGLTYADNGVKYRVAATNSVSTVYSAATTLTGIPPAAPVVNTPVIEDASNPAPEQPRTPAQSRLDAIRGIAAPANEVIVGSDITYSVGATGNGLTYQWFKDGVPVPGANGESFTAANVQPEHVYTVAVTNANGGTQTREVQRPVFVHPVTIEEEPAPTTVLQPGAGAVLNVTATGSGPIYYQWCRYFPDTDTFEAIPFAATEHYTATQPGFYFVAINNRAGILTWSEVVEVVAAPEGTGN